MTPEIIEKFLQVGAVGGIAAFVLWRLEPKMERIADALNRFSRVLLQHTLAVNNLTQQQKREIELLRAELDEAEKGR